MDTQQPSEQLAALQQEQEEYFKKYPAGVKVPGKVMARMNIVEELLMQARAKVRQERIAERLKDPAYRQKLGLDS